MNHDVQICLRCFFWVGILKTNEGVGTDVMDWLKFSVAKVFFRQAWDFFRMRDFLEGVWHLREKKKVAPIFRMMDPLEILDFFFFTKNEENVFNKKKDAIMQYDEILSPWLF